MPDHPKARDVLDREFLEIRSRLLDIASALDRIERATDAGTVTDDPRLAQLRRGIETILQEGGDRAAAVQMVFSDAYQKGWQKS